jgi:hypothetical protein
VPGNEAADQAAKEAANYDPDTRTIQEPQQRLHPPRTLVATTVMRIGILDRRCPKINGMCLFIGALLYFCRDFSQR